MSKKSITNNSVMKITLVGLSSATLALASQNVYANEVDNSYNEVVIAEGSTTEAPENVVIESPKEVDTTVPEKPETPTPDEVVIVPKEPSIPSPEDVIINPESPIPDTPSEGNPNTPVIEAPNEKAKEDSENPTPNEGNPNTPVIEAPNEELKKDPSPKDDLKEELGAENIDTSTIERPLENNNQTATATEASEKGLSQVGTTSTVTNQIVSNVSSVAPVVTKDGYTIVDTVDSKLVLRNNDGSTVVVTPNKIGGKVNSDNTISVKTAKGEMVTLPETGDAASSWIAVLGLSFLAMIGFSNAKSLSFENYKIR